MEGERTRAVPESSQDAPKVEKRPNGLGRAVRARELEASFELFDAAEISRLGTSHADRSQSIRAQVVEAELLRHREGLTPDPDGLLVPAVISQEPSETAEHVRLGACCRRLREEIGGPLEMTKAFVAPTLHPGLLAEHHLHLRSSLCIASFQQSIKCPFEDFPAGARGAEAGTAKPKQQLERDVAVMPEVERGGIEPLGRDERVQG